VTSIRRCDPTRALDLNSIGHEGRLQSDDHQSLKTWLRLLSCSTQIETVIRKRLRQEAGISLARFDFMAQLHRHPDGLRMSVLSRYLMVTGGNVTGLADELEKEGLVERSIEPEDRRSLRVALTRKGRRVFDKLAATHEAWVIDLFSGVAKTDIQQLYHLLGTLRVQLHAEPTPPAVMVRTTRRSGVTA
jgi:DNA-binding MarR family transcriptional regulator